MQKVWGIALLLGAMAIGAISYQLLQQKTEFTNVLLYPAPRDMMQFQLTSHLGKPITRENLHGHWTLAFVGYTFCPDICPMTMATLAGSYPQLKQALPAGESLQLWFVSVDPKRDTIAQLANYVGYFEQPAIVGVTANHDHLFPFVREMGLMYALTTTTDEDYRVDHSASIVLINPQGKLVAMFKPESSLNSNSIPVITKAQLLRDFPAVIAQLTH